MSWQNEPYVKYIMEEDKHLLYRSAASAGFIDPDNDFLIGPSGGFLMNMGNFKFTNIHLLREAALTYEKEGVYIKEKAGSLAFERFREREEYRRKHGYTAYCKDIKGGTQLLRITGELYNFINYGQILKLDKSSVTKDSKSAKKIPGIPEFFGYQYWYTKIIEFARNNNFHIVLLKPRRSGLTYIESSSNANYVNLLPRCTVIHAAYDKKYLTMSGGISDFAKAQLDYYETETPFVRGYLSEDLEDIELGYKPEGTNIRKGYRSKLLSVSFNRDVMSAAGKDAYKISGEELSNAPDLKEFLNLTIPTTRTGSFTTGIYVGWGTGGAEEANWEHFEEVFYQPGIYGMFPMENIFEADSREQICGVFKPYIESLEGIDTNPKSSTFGKLSMDENGNTDYEVAYNIAIHEREVSKKTKPVKEYLKDIGQFCIRPSEAFTNTGDNMFTTPEFTEHVKRVLNDPEFKTYWDGMVVEVNGVVKFMTNEELSEKGYSHLVHPFVEDVPFNKTKDFHGCLRIYQMPLRDKVSRTIPNFLYRVWHDPVGVEKEADQVTNQNSLASIIVYMRPNNETEDIGDKIVATFRGRPSEHIKINTILKHIAIFYNARIQFENDRGQVQSDFKNILKALHLLEREPNVAWDPTLAAKSHQGYGMSMGGGTSDRSLKALGYLHDWLYTIRSHGLDGKPIYTFHYITDIPILLELLRFAPKKNLDTISCLKIGMFDMKEVATREIKTRLTATAKSQSVFKRQWFK